MARSGAPSDKATTPSAPRRWSPRQTVTAVDLSTTAPVSHVTSLFERRSFTEGSFVDDRVRLSYEAHGTGDRTVVLMHGLLLDAQLNRRLAADLGERGFRVILLDLPGHGKSDKPRHASAHRMDSYARHVVGLLDELDIDEAVVGGVSLGANVALHVAIQAPERIRGLIVEMPVLEWAVPGAAMVFLPLLLGVHYAAPLVRLVSAVARRLPQTRIPPLDSFVTTLTLQPEEAAAVLHGMLVGPITPTYEERHSIAAPALVIGHKADFIHPFTDADHLTRQLPNARLVQARSIMELRVFPARLTEKIGEFLDEVWGPPRLRDASAPRLRRAEQA
jgi:pimeloyl-ACP methyl ester carboxylesterase